MYPYAKVESTLKKFFDIEPERATAFRGRLRNLQKLGLTPLAPGSGKRVQYSANDVCDLALAMSLSEFGADPREILREIPTGTFSKIYDELKSMNRPTFVYVPYYFSGHNSEIKFMSYKDATQFIKHRPRAAVIDIDLILCFLESELAEIHVISPFARKG